MRIIQTDPELRQTLIAAGLIRPARWVTDLRRICLPGRQVLRTDAIGLASAARQIRSPLPEAEARGNPWVAEIPRRPA